MSARVGSAYGEGELRPLDSPAILLEKGGELPMTEKKISIAVNTKVAFWCDQRGENKNTIHMRVFLPDKTLCFNFKSEDRFPAVYRELRKQLKAAGKPCPETEAA
jgi:hypothetical protein